MKKYRNLICAIILALLVLNLSFESFAQKRSSQKTIKSKVKVSPADALSDEGERLFKQGTAASYQAALEKYKQALSLYEDKNDSTRIALSYAQIGRVYRRLNDQKSAYQNYEKAYQIFDSIGDNSGRASTLTNVAVIAREIGQYNESLNYYQRALPLMRLIKNKNGEAQVLGGIGECQLNLGQTSQSLSNLQQSFAILQTLGATEDRVRTVYNLGRAYLASNENQKGLNLLEQALNDSRQYNNPILEGDILEALAAHHDSIGNLTKAIDLRRQIFTAYQSSKASTVTHYRKLMSANNLVVSKYKYGDFKTGILDLNDAINYAVQHNESFALPFLQRNMGIFLADQEKFNEAMSHFNKALSYSKQTDNKYVESEVLAEIGWLYLRFENFDQALNYFNQSKRIMPKDGWFAKIAQGKILAGMIRLYSNQEDFGKVNQLISEGRSLGLESGNNQGSVRFLAAIAYSQSSEKKFQQSIQTFTKVFQLAKQIGHEVEKAKILYDASEAYMKLGDVQNGLQITQTSHDFFKSIGNDRMDMKTHIRMAEGLIQTNQLQSAFQNLNSALEFAQNLNEQNSQMQIYFLMGRANSQNQAFDTAIQYYNQALQLSRNSDDKSGQKTILNEIGDAYEKSGNKKKAKEFRDKAKKIRQ